MGTLLLWLLYTLLYHLPISEVLAAFVQHLPGIAAVFSLHHSGHSASERFLDLRRVSVKGVVALALVSPALAGPGRPGAANLAHAALFDFWDVRKAMIFSAINPFLGALMLAGVTEVAGIGWGLQVRHGGTIGRSTLHHWFLLTVMSLFGQ